MVSLTVTLDHPIDHARDEGEEPPAEEAHQHLGPGHPMRRHTSRRSHRTHPLPSGHAHDRNLRGGAPSGNGALHPPTLLSTLKLSCRRQATLGPSLGLTGSMRLSRSGNLSPRTGNAMQPGADDHACRDRRQERPTARSLARSTTSAESVIQILAAARVSL
jgi:hypothetical protein